MLAAELLLLRPMLQSRFERFCEAGDPSGFFAWLGGLDARETDLLGDALASVDGAALVRLGGHAASIEPCRSARSALPRPAGRQLATSRIFTGISRQILI